MRNQKLYDSLKKKEKNGNLSEFESDLLKDWGNDNIFGPWTEFETEREPSTFKFYESYYLVDISNEQANTDTL